ncbi:AAA family ATPase, partial [Saccharothrix sp. MB29]|nr:AAA family ATPase [Saccharothrix sp. MB29]
RQVTADSKTYLVPRPFMVIGTQNPIELQGTYRLPEAQLDRFLMRVAMGYPDHGAEVQVLLADSEGATPDRLPAVVE